MRNNKPGWFVMMMLLALLCTAPCMAQDSSGSQNDAATKTDAVKVPVWRRGALYQPASVKAQTASARSYSKPAASANDGDTLPNGKGTVKIVQYESPSDGLEPSAPPLPTQLTTNTTTNLDPVSCTPNCTTACAPSCTTACEPSCAAAPSCNSQPPRTILGNWLGNGNGGVGGSCAAGGNTCNGNCNGCGNSCCTCGGFWQHRSGFFGEFLYLRATGVDMAYAFQQNGIGGPGTVPNGSVGVLHPNYTPGFRIGGNYAIDCFSSIVVSYAQFDSNTSSNLTSPAGVGGTVQSLVLQPNSVNAGSTATSDAASYNIGFKTANIDYRRLLIGSECFAVNYSVGVAYGHLQQGFQQTGSFAPPAGVIQTNTAIHYDGGGLRYGLDFQRKIGQRGFSLYGKSFVDVLFGQFEANLSQVNQTTTAVQALSNWRDDRVVPMLELELGGAWTSCNGRLRVSAGYYNSFWFNAVTTPQYVQAVQNANYTSLGQTIAFDGLVTRAEIRF